MSPRGRRQRKKRWGPANRTRSASLGMGGTCPHGHRFDVPGAMECDICHPDTSKWTPEKEADHRARCEAAALYCRIQEGKRQERARHSKVLAERRKVLSGG